MRIKINYVQWIRRLTTCPEMSTSASFLHSLGAISITHFFRSKDPATYRVRHINRFYANLLTVWLPLRCYDPGDELEVRREPLWDNASISWNVSSAKKKIWEDAGVSILAHICKEGEGRLLSHQELNEKFNVNSSFLDMLGLRQAVPWN